MDMTEISQKRQKIYHAISCDKDHLHFKKNFI